MHKRILISYIFAVLGCGLFTSDLSRSSVDASEVKMVEISPKAIFDLAKKSPAELTLVNFWASWCLPCRHEFPDLLKFRSDWKSKNVNIEFVSVDFPADIGDAKSFLIEQKVDFPTYLRTGDDQTLIKSIDPKWKGALPTTFILNQKGEIVFRFDGPVKLPRLEAKVSEVLNSKLKGKLP